MNFYSTCKEYRQLVNLAWTYMWTILHCDGVSHNSGTIFPGLAQFIIPPTSLSHLGTCYWTILHGGPVSCQFWHMSFLFKFRVINSQKLSSLFPVEIDSLVLLLWLRKHFVKSVRCLHLYMLIWWFCTDFMQWDFFLIFHKDILL